MAVETIRNIKINKRNKYEKDFTQVDTQMLGIAAGQLKLVGLRLYLYLVSNKNGFNFTLSPLAYGRWYGVDYINETGELDQGKRSAVNKAIRDGLNNLKDMGYVKEIATNNYEFFEDCQKTDSSSENKLFLKEQSVPSEDSLNKNSFNF